MSTSNTMVDFIIQEKFLELLKARRNGEKYEFKKELRNELEKKSQSTSRSSSREEATIKSLLRELRTH